MLSNHLGGKLFFKELSLVSYVIIKTGNQEMCFLVGVLFEYVVLSPLPWLLLFCLSLGSFPILLLCYRKEV